MKQTKNGGRAAWFVAALFGLASGVAAPTFAADPQDVSGKDPARWTRPDDTPEARFQTSKKEAGAALQEANAQCKAAGGTAMQACLKDARNRYEQDLAEAKKARDAKP